MPTTIKTTSHKNALDIRLAESVVFVRAGDATGRQRSIQPDAPPGMVRGLLVLTLGKPIRITSIEVELLGKTVTEWPEGVAARRTEAAEEHDIYSQSYVFFRAGHSPGTVTRRNISVGPGLSLEHDEEDHSEESSIQHEGRSDEERERPSFRGSRGRRPQRRHMSVDQMHYQRAFVDHRENARSSAASPVFYPDEHAALLTPSVSTLQRSPLGTAEQSPADSLEDVRRALEAEQDFSGFARSPSRPDHSSSSIWSSREVPDSRRVSLDEDRDLQIGSSIQPSPHHPSLHGVARSRLRDIQEVEGDDTARGRKNKRGFSFASALLDAMKDRVRSSSPRVELGEHGHSGCTTPPRGRTMDRTLLHPESPSVAHHETTQRELFTLGRVGEVLGFEVDDGRAHGDGWKEFRKGVYTYPISFAIPPTAPPSLQVDYGSVVWKLKAVVHRPGTFKTKLTASQEITVVVTPSEDDTEETESIIVERQWDTQMQYLIIISGRSFIIGGTMPITITFMPWTKMKIHRISVLIEERVDYWTGFRRVVRTDSPNRLSLLSLKYPKKDGPHLLPLASDDPDAFRQSPLSEVIGPEDDVGEVVSRFMGPGPWTIQKDLLIPQSEGLHITNKNRRSNISISHMLKIIFRVERGDDFAVDSTTSKRKLFDIVVQTPVHVLSRLCNPEHTSLPPYSSLPDTVFGTQHAHSHMLAGHSADDVRVGRPRYPGSTTPIAGTAPHSRATSLAPPASSSSSLSGHFSRTMTAVSDLTDGEHPVAASNPVSRRQSLHERTGTTVPELFERLIAGQESEDGEAPPSYEASVESAGVRSGVVYA